MRWTRRLPGALAAALAIAALCWLGWLWRADRARSWELPRLGAPLVLLRAAPPDSGADIWLVAVNPRCGHCRRVLEALARRPSEVRVGALVIDTPRRPAPAMLGALPGAPIWWDEANQWRRRWGHRVYGEVIRFDARGGYLSTRTYPIPDETPPPSIPRRR